MFATFTVSHSLLVVVFTRAENTNGFETKWRFDTWRTPVNTLFINKSCTKFTDDRIGRPVNTSRDYKRSFGLKYVTPPKNTVGT